MTLSLYLVVMLMIGIEYGVEVELKQAKEDEEEFSLEETADRVEDLMPDRKSVV